MPHTFSSTAPATPQLSSLSLHDALPISPRSPPTAQASAESTFGVDAEACKRARVEVPGDHDVLGLLERSQRAARGFTQDARSEEHTSELQSQSNLVCRLLLEKKNEKKVT